MTDHSNNNSPLKAYNNPEFLSSSSARSLRILSEYIEPEFRFKQYQVKDTIVFFGSARIRSPKEAQEEFDKVQQESKITDQTTENAPELVIAARNLKMAKYYNDAVELARLLTTWSQQLRGTYRRFLICSGGGPGIMEAANRGAALAQGKSIGLNISLPFEQHQNPYLSPELSFQFHYFFMRKFWFIYPAKGLVIFPGGFGTLDELFEVLTLIQTKKLRKPIPIVVYGKEYWNEVLNIEAMVKWGMVSPTDLNLLKFADTPQEAFEYLTEQLETFYCEIVEEPVFSE